MTPDLMFPILFILIMLIIITEMQAPLALLLIGLLFVPISFLFALSASSYTHLFTADITSFYTDPYFYWMLQGIMFTVPAMAFFRLVYIRKGWDQAL